MKKILIAVTLLALSSTAFATGKGCEHSSNNYVCEAALNDYTTTVDQNAIDAEQNTKISTALQTADSAVSKNTEQDAAISGKVDLSTFNDAVSTQTGINSDLQTQINTKVSTDTYTADNAIQAANDASQNTAINKAQSTANVALGIGVANSVGIAALNEKKVDKTTQYAKDVSQDAAIDSKVDKSVYASDKEAQASTDASQNVAISTETSERKSADTQLQANIDTEATTRTNADTTLKANIDQNKAEQSVTDAGQNKAIATKASKKELASETASRKSADAALSSRIDSNDATLVQHDERITSNTNRIGSVEKRVSNFENQTNRRFSDIDKRIGDNRKVASAGIAGAGAMANIPQVTQNGNFSVGAGIGGYDGEQAVAVGFSARVTNSVTTKVSVSTNTQSELLWGAGVGVEW